MNGPESPVNRPPGTFSPTGGEGWVEEGTVHGHSLLVQWLNANSRLFNSAQNKSSRTSRFELAFDNMSSH